MAAKQRQSRAPRRGGSSMGSGLVWFLVGAITGSLVTWAAVGRDPAAQQVRAVVGRTVGHPIGVDPTTPPPKPKFEFYTLLPEMEEVVVPEEDLAAPRPAPAESDTADEEASTRKDDAPSKAETPLKPGHYILQVASFRSMQEADGLKAQLTLLGFSPVVQSVAINSDEKWYRVRIGPYTDRGSLEAARVRLRTDGHDNPLVVRVKKG